MRKRIKRSTGAEIPQEETKISAKEALVKAQGLCASQERCRHDIKQKLKQWGADVNEMDGILDQLEDEKFIDQERFASAFTKDKFRFHQWGKTKIDQALKQKYISESLIAKAFEEISDEDYMKTLTDELFKKKRFIGEVTDFEMKNKLIRYAVSKGYELEAIYDKVDHVIETKPKTKNR